MKPVDLAEVRKLVSEADDGTLVDGDDAAVNRDPYDKRLALVAERVRQFDRDARAMRVSVRNFRDLIQVLLILPENDPRRLGGLMVEIDTDAGVIAQALERLRPRLDRALEVFGSEPEESEKALDSWQ